MKTLLLSLFSFSLFISASFAQDSSASFNRFINNSPKAKANMEQVISSEEIISACMESKAKMHIGVKMQKGGQIYIFQKGNNNKHENNRFLANNKKVTDAIFAMKEKSDFNNLASKYKSDGTSYCYVQNRLGTNIRTVAWAKNETDQSTDLAPQNIKELFNTMLVISNNIAQSQTGKSAE